MNLRFFYFLIFLNLGMSQTFEFTQVPNVVGPCEQMQLQWSGGQSPYELDVGIPDVDGNFFTTRFFSTKDTFSIFPLQGVELASTIVRVRIFDDNDDQITTKSIPVNNNDCSSSSDQNFTFPQSSPTAPPSGDSTATITTATIFQTSSSSDSRKADQQLAVNKKVSVGGILGATLGGLSGVVLIVLLLFYCRRRRARAARESSAEPFPNIDTIDVGQGYSTPVSETPPGLQTLSPLRLKRDRGYSETSSVANPFISPGTDQDQMVTLNRIQEIQRVLTQLEQETSRMARVSRHEEPTFPRRSIPSTRSSQRPPAYWNGD